MVSLEKTLGGHDQGLVGYNWGPGNMRRVNRRAEVIGLEGRRAWVRLIPAESQGYLTHNDPNRAHILAKGGGSVAF